MRSQSKVFIFSSLTALVALAGSTAALAQEQGRVLSSQAVIQQVAVPRQVCSDQQVAVQGQKSGAGGLMGAIAGGAIGNNVGAGSGRALATMIGVIGGAAMGDRVEGAPPAQVQTVRNCTTQNFYENRTVGYNVVYEFNGKQFNVQMPNDPGQYVQLQVTPVGAATQPSIPAPVIQPMVQAPVAIPAPVVAAPQVVYAAPQVVYARPYYPVVYPSVSIGFGWRGGYAHGHGQRHWH